MPTPEQKRPEDLAREVAHSMPPCDFGSPEAIKIFAAAITAERTAAEAEISEVHSLLDNDPSKIIRNAKDGYPDGRPDRVLTLKERVKALCKYAADYKRWLDEQEALSKKQGEELDRLKAREIQLMVVGENAYKRAVEVLPDYDWDGFTKTPGIAVEALIDKIQKLQNREHLEGCYEVYGDCTCEEIHYKQIEETEHQKSLKEAFEKHSWELADELKLERARLDWLDQHASFVADSEYVIGPYKIGELRKMADDGIAHYKLKTCVHCQDFPHCRKEKQEPYYGVLNCGCSACSCGKKQSTALLSPSVGAGKVSIRQCFPTTVCGPCKESECFFADMPGGSGCSCECHGLAAPVREGE